MLRGINKKWKEQIAYFFGNNSFSANSLKIIIEKSIDFVNAITTDQTSNFSSTFKSFGVTPKNPYAKVNNHNVLNINDVPHLLKSTRNILDNGYRIKIDEGLVKWRHIETCFKINDENSLHMIPKITENHIHLPKYGEKMKVLCITNFQ